MFFRQFTSLNFPHSAYFHVLILFYVKEHKKYSTFQFKNSTNTKAKERREKWKKQYQKK